MSTVTGPNYSVDNQITFVVQWFRTWSELQKDDFVEILAQKLAPGSGMNGLVNGMQKLDTESRRVSLFSCQVKLFNEWWATWSEEEKEKLTTRLKESDPKFWAEVQDELNGTRKKLEDAFYILTSHCVGNTATETEPNNVKVNGAEKEEVEIENENEVLGTSTNGVNMNGESDNQEKLQNGGVNITVNGSAEEEEEKADDDVTSG